MRATTGRRSQPLWGENSPENFANALVGAEIARLEGREVEAEHLYEQAIRSAREQDFVQNEGLAYELAARFYAARGFEPFADLYCEMPDSATCEGSRRQGSPAGPPGPSPQARRTGT
jgi:hypothetical protein